MEAEKLYRRWVQPKMSPACQNKRLRLNWLDITFLPKRNPLGIFQDPLQDVSEGFWLYRKSLSPVCANQVDQYLAVSLVHVVQYSSVYSLDSVPAKLVVKLNSNPLSPVCCFL
jgi:hypothetical protein